MDGMAFAKKVVNRSRRSMIITATICFALVVIMVYTGFIDGQFSDIPLAGSIIGVLFMLIFLLVGVLAVRSLVADRNTKHPLLQALEHPEQAIIQKIVVQSIKVRGVRTTYNLVLELNEGTAQTISNIDPKQIDEFLSYLEATLPQMTISKA